MEPEQNNENFKDEIIMDGENKNKSNTFQRIKRLQKLIKKQSEMKSYCT